MSATLFDLEKYTVEPKPDPNRRATPAEPSEAIASADCADCLQYLQHWLIRNYRHYAESDLEQLLGQVDAAITPINS